MHINQHKLQAHVPETPAHMSFSKKDVAIGAKFGAIFGAGFTVLGLIIFASTDGKAFQRNAVGLGSAIAVYILGGVIAGMIVGATRWLTSRYWIYAYVVGVLAAAPVSFGALLALHGMPNQWNFADYGTIGVLSIAYGVAATRYFRGSGRMRWA